MALEKQIVIDKIEILEYGDVQVRTVTRILEDGVVLSSSYHRRVITPGDDCSREDARVKAVCAVIHTEELKQKRTKDEPA